MACLEIKDLTYYYPDATLPALNKLNLSIEEGEFVLLLGGSGSGKSSLAKAIAGLIPDFYGGKFGGEVCIDGKSLHKMSRKEIVRKVGMVFQDPENQLVMTGVEREIVFGMENLGLANSLMQRRYVEVREALSLSTITEQSVPELSGGQKQKIVLASILAMQPSILILDEPTSQLDPVAGEEILTIIRRLNEENGITVILIEQRLERCFHLADRFVVMEKGRIVYQHQDGRRLARWAAAGGSPFLPPLSKIFAFAGQWEIPLTVKEGRKIIRSVIAGNESAMDELKQKRPASEKIRAASPGNSIEMRDNGDNGTAQNLPTFLEVNNIWYNYENGNEALKNVSFKVNPGAFLAIMGENAAGKTTLLKSIRGFLKPGRGDIKIWNRNVQGYSAAELARTVAYLSQNPNDYLFMPTVREELMFTRKNLKLKNDGTIDQLLEKLQLGRYALLNPRDLSSGERQRVALAAVLAAEPQLIMLDEPTRGLDYELKKVLGEILLERQKEGLTIFLVTHDVEFAAEYARDVMLMSQGMIVVRGPREEILSCSAFYSPQVSKLFYNYQTGIVTQKDGERALKELARNCARNNNVRQNSPQKPIRTQGLKSANLIRRRNNHV